MRLAPCVFLGVGVAFQTALVAAQDLSPAAPEPAAVAPAPPDGELPVSLDRIRRALSQAAPGDERLRLLDLTEYVVVVGEAPATSMLGDADLSAGPDGTTHDRMLAIARPSRVDQVAATDVLGVVTATAFATLVPPLIRTVTGWFSRAPAIRSSNWEGYTQTMVFGTAVETPPTADHILFHRPAGSRVSFHARASHPTTSGFIVTVDGQEWSRLEHEVADRTIPDELLAHEPIGNVHSLAVTRLPDTVLVAPLSVDLLVVVHATSEP